MRRIVALLLVVTLLALGGMTVFAEGVIVIGETNNTTNSYGGETELKPGSKIKVDGEYTISLADPAAKCFSKEKDLSGYSVGYLTTKEDGSASDSVFGPVGTHTVLRIFVSLTNRSKQETNWLKRVKCDVVYDEQYTFETLAVQYNPDQTNYEGETGYASIEARPTEPLVSMTVGFFVSVPYIVRDSNKPLWAYITIDNDVYAVNLREVMVLG